MNGMQAIENIEQSPEDGKSEGPGEVGETISQEQTIIQMETANQTSGIVRY
jgi:hypothetical protein